MAASTMACAERVSSETLSAWRDDLLSPAEMARLRVHTPGCEACRARLADFDAVATALLRQRELEPSERIVEGVRRRAAWGGRRRFRLMPGGGGRLWGGLGALGAVAAVLLLFVYFFSQGPGRQGNNPNPTASTIVNSSPTPTLGERVVTPPPTVTPSGPFSQVVSVQEAWGANAAKQTLTTQVDATHIFWAEGVSPDGKSLLGYEYAVSSGNADLSVPAQAGLFDLASRRVTTIGVSQSAGYPVGCCMDDGRFLIATDSTAPGATCGLCHIRYWSYDMQTGTLWQVATGSDYQGINRVYLDHGLLILGTGEGTEVADLAAQRITSLAGADPSGTLVYYAWPYAIFSEAEGGGNPGPMRVLDLATGKTTMLPQPVAATLNGPIVLTGDTLFASAVSQDDQVTTLYEMDHFLASGAQPRELGRYLGAVGVVAANDRVVVLAGVIWDRLEGVFVSEGPGAGEGGPGAALSGTTLAVFTLNGNGTPGGASPQQVTIYDTATLPELVIP